MPLRGNSWPELRLYSPICTSTHRSPSSQLPSPVTSSLMSIKVSCGHEAWQHPPSPAIPLLLYPWSHDYVLSSSGR